MKQSAIFAATDRARAYPSPPRERSLLPVLHWVVAGLTFCFIALDLLLLMRNRAVPRPAGGPGNDAVEAVAALAYGAFALFGARRAARQPANPAGWFFCCGAMLTAAGAVASEYASYGFRTSPGSLPLANWVAWLGVMAWWAGAGSVVAFGLLFLPSGRLASPRTRVAAWLSLACLGVMVLLHAVTPGPLYGEFSVAVNPIGIDGAEGVLQASRNLAWLLFCVAGTIGLVSALARRDEAVPGEREQLVWLAVAGALVVIAVLVWAVTGSDRRPPPGVVQAWLVVAVVALPVSAMVSVARVAALRRSLTRVVLAREEERQRIQRDLHDGLAPTLAATALQLDLARSLVRTDPAAAQAILGRLGNDLKGAIADVRHLVQNLRPPALEQLGLVPAIEQRAASLGRTGPAAAPNDFAVSVETTGDLTSLPAAVEVAAFCIVSEALHNASRHGGASTCTVRLDLGSALEVLVADDGEGLSPEPHSGIGLTSMRERAAELGGTCSISAGPDGGTVVRARLPIAPT